MKKIINIRVLIPVVFILVSSGMIQAQDFHLSQFNNSPMILNPATTGMLKDSYRANLHQRTQWMNVASKPFLTEVLSFDTPYDQLGFGAYILNNTAGVGNFNELHFLTSVAYEILEKNQFHKLSTGIQLGFIHKSVNVNNLNFASQYSQETGDFDNNLPSNEDFQKTSETLIDLNWGVFYHNRDKMDVFGSKSSTSNIIPVYAGFSAFHLTQPKERFITKNYVQYRKWVGYGGAMYAFHEDIALEMNLLYMRQAKNNELQFGGICYYRVKKNTESYIFNLGTMFRWKDAFILQLGGNYKEYTVNLSYDINVSSLKVLSGGRGGFEISISYIRKAEKIASFFRSSIF